MHLGTYAHPKNAHAVAEPDQVWELGTEMQWVWDLCGRAQLETRIFTPS